MTEPETLTPLEQAVVDIHTIATDTGKNRGMAWAILASSLLVLGALIILGILVAPVIRTARTVENVAGPGAQARQETQTKAFVTGFLCAARENTSESRVMDGKEPLILRKGCPPYNFTADAPIIPAFPTTTTTAAPAKTKTTQPRRSTTTRHESTTNPPPSTTSVTATTQAFDQCPTATLPIIGTCLTVPR